MSERRQYRAYELARPKVLANFRTEPWERDKKPSRIASREGNSKAHLANVRRLPCLVCGVQPAVKIIDAHHLKAGIGMRGLGMKNPDRYAVPLCRYPCHHGVERAGTRGETAYFAELGVGNPIGIAARLWRCRVSFETMWVVIVADLAHRRTHPQGPTQ